MMLVNVQLNWLNWFHIHILVVVPLVILIGYMIFLSPLLEVIKMSMSKISFLAQLESVILCHLNAFLWPMILIALCLELIDTSFLEFFLYSFPL